MKHSLLWAIIYLFPSIESIDLDLVVQTSTGPIQGVVVKSFTDQEVTAFYGVPYAEPPVGDLRFKPPVPVKPWTEVFQASTKPLPCYQHYTKRGHEMRLKSKTFIPRPWSEDCLKLNIWAPRVDLDDKNVSIPIMFIIHSGSFVTGSSLLPFSDGSTMATVGEVLVVTLNYRLGPFGFLSFGHPDAPGNMGLMDQQVALKWVHENLPKFGRGVGKIMLWGVGAGGASVGYQILSPGSAGLFPIASVRSGAPICSWAYHSPEHSHRNAGALADKLDCKQVDVSEVIQCLRTKHPEDIVDAYRSNIQQESDVSEQFRPTIDGVFITDSPLELLKTGRFNNVSVQSTTMAEDGSTTLLSYGQGIVETAAADGISRSGFREVVKRLAPHLGAAALTMVEEFYVDKCHQDDPIFLRDTAVQVYTDFIVDCCVNEFLDYVSDRGNQVFRAVRHLTLAKNPSWMGTVHGTDNLFYFGYPMLGEKAGFTEEEAERSKSMIKRRINNAVEKVSRAGTASHSYNRSTRSYYSLSSTGYTYENDWKGRECALWNMLKKFEDGRSTCNLKA